MIGNKQHSDVDEDIVLDFMEDDQTIDNNESEEGNFNDSLAGTNTIGFSCGFKKKLYAGIACLVLAVLVHLLFKSLIDGQVQQKYLADNMLNQIPMTTLYAEQALTNKGEIAAFTNSFSQLKSNMQALVSPTTMVSKVNGLLLSDSANKEEAFAQWSDYEQAANQYIALTKVLQSTKDKLASINVYLENASDETTLLVNSVAKEGRVKKKDVAKNKYLFLTSSSSNIISLINHLLVTTSGYYEPSTDKQKLATEQNILLLRIKEELARIIDNSAAVVATVAEPLKQELQKIDSLLVDISDSADSLNKSHTLVQNLSAQTPLLQTSLQSLVQPSLVSQILRALSYILPLSLLALAAWFLWSGSKSRPGTANNDSILTEALADQQESILKLLDEMSALADGDLTVEAEVTDRITGAIADSVNFAVIEMRDLVSQINRASVEVANESALAVENAQSVSQANMQQADQITLAAQGMQRITDTMRTMSQHAHQSSEMAQESTKVATQGAQAVRDTISGMEDMREQIQDTSKRIKRLGESSQRIGDIVALIDEIAEQTNILSLNAAIQASMAGEAGRGFAVVSDEVQGLAERSSEATKKIAALVAAIQNDTNDAMKSMEKATQQVVSGTRVADTAGDALAEIEAVSQKLSILIADISKSAGSQKRAVAKIADNVSVVSQSSTNTSRKAQDSANSIGKLLDLANELETSVSRFKLPTS